MKWFAGVTRLTARSGYQQARYAGITSQHSSVNFFTLSFMSQDIRNLYELISSMLSFGDTQQVRCADIARLSQCVNNGLPPRLPVLKQLQPHRNIRKDNKIIANPALT